MEKFRINGLKLTSVSTNGKRMDFAASEAQIQDVVASLGYDIKDVVNPSNRKSGNYGEYFPMGSISVLFDKNGNPNGLRIFRWNVPQVVFDRPGDICDVAVTSHKADETYTTGDGRVEKYKMDGNQSIVYNSAAGERRRKDAQDYRREAAYRAAFARL